MALIDPSGGDSLEIASVLADGITLVVLDDPVTVAPARARTLLAKVLAQKAILMFTDRVRGIRADLVLNSRPTGYTGIGRGRGRVREIELEVHVSGRHLHPHTGRIRLAATGDTGTAWSHLATATAGAQPMIRAV
ncbi:hypothetical protein NDR87_14315 [Nocardia sp. CDC159]|uniref:Uncharacterized protein n=1 Tax=Nocardia pulmonis TaxID=2951408 RepID=A0A9X2E7Q8_9NOCA|nr:MULTISPECIES: hypothetical protein [Nocardia]MCM6774405.1 hypothetical protein [Nocardia pulmonis]MCM6787529.1 hypothetical protein [Nocardia sp. CDC159]